MRRTLVGAAIATLVAAPLSWAAAQPNALARAIAAEAQAAIESNVRFPQGRPRLGTIAAGSTATIPLRLERGSCYELLVLTEPATELDVVVRDRAGTELARARGDRRIVARTWCPDRPSRAIATLGPAPRATRYATQLFTVNALRRVE